MYSIRRKFGSEIILGQSETASSGPRAQGISESSNGFETVHLNIVVLHQSCKSWKILQQTENGQKLSETQQWT